MEGIKEPHIMAVTAKKLGRTGEWWRKIAVSALIAVGAAAIMFSCYLMINGRIDLDGMITILVVTVFSLIFSLSLMERLSV